MFQFDPKILKALKLAGEQMMKEARERRSWNMTPPTSFAKGGWVGAVWPPCNFKPDLTTSQKMKAFKFIQALETAKEL